MLGLPAAWADDFRIENQVFVGRSSEPQAASTTIFQNGIVYDYLQEPSEVTVFDPDHGRFILLNEAKRIRTEVGTDEVAAFVARLQQWARGHDDAYMQFLADPEFETSSDDSDEAVVFSSQWMTYRLHFDRIGVSPAVVQQYRRFSDAYAQLNTLLNPGARLPFARIYVNRAVEAEGKLPREVKLVITPGGTPFSPQRTTIRSEHRFIDQLVESDRQRLAQTREYMAMFQPVRFAEYQKALRGDD